MPGVELTHLGTRGVWAARVTAVALFLALAAAFATLVARDPTFVLATMGGGAAFLTYSLYLGLLKAADLALGYAAGD